MEAKHIQVYNVKTKGIKAFLIYAVASAIFGLYGIIGFFLFKEKLIFSQSLEIYIYITVFSIIQYYIGLNNLKNSKYFVSWNSKGISYFLQKNEYPEIIETKHIQSIQINDSEIKIQMKNGEEKSFNLNLLFIPKRNMVVKYFETVNNNLDNEIENTSKNM